MRSLLLLAFSILAGSSPFARSQPAKDAGDLFISAYLSAQRAEKEEQVGHLNRALSTLQEAARKLDEVAAEFPQWNPAVVKYRKERTANAISRIKEKIAQSGPNHEDESASPGQPAKPVPQDQGQLELRLRELKQRLKERESVPKEWRALEFNGLPYYAVPL